MTRYVILQRVSATIPGDPESTRPNIVDAWLVVNEHVDAESAPAAVRDWAGTLEVGAGQSVHAVAVPWRSWKPTRLEARVQLAIAGTEVTA